jgi:hypothetical protein
MPLDLNKGVGGKYIYLCYRRDGIPVSNLVVISATDPDIGPPPGYQKAVNLESNLPQDLDEGAGGCYIYVCLEKDITSKQFMYGVNLVCDAADSRIKSSQYISYPKLGMYFNGGDTEFNGNCSGVRHTYEPIPIAAPPGFIGLREYLNTDRSHRISLLFQLMDATKIDLSDLFQMEAKRWEPAMRRYRSIQDISLLQFIETGVKEGSKVLKPVRNIPELVRQYYLNGKERLCDDSLTLVRDLIFRQRAHELIKREKIKKEKTK